jgi:pimeloyl-ACP methyl ester carboxylesterase
MNEIIVRFILGAFFTISFALLGLWLYRRLHRRPPTVKPYSDSQFLLIKGCRIHYRQSGKGRDIVLLHGIGASVFIWRHIYPMLSQHYRVTAIDFLGFGASDKPIDEDLGLDAQAERTHKLIEQLHLKNPILIGSSMGGTIALWILRNYKRHYAGAMVLAPATNPKLVKPYHKALIPIGKRSHVTKPSATTNMTS